MVSVLDYLRRGFECLENVPKDEFDALQDRVKTYKINKDRNADELQVLIGMTSHYFGVVGSKLAQISAIKSSLERQIERGKIRLAQGKGISLSKKTEIERESMLDDGLYALIVQHDEVKSVEVYFTNMRETLYMLHYSLRREVETASDNGTRLKVHHGN